VKKPDIEAGQHWFRSNRERRTVLVQEVVVRTVVYEIVDSDEGWEIGDRRIEGCHEFHCRHQFLGITVTCRYCNQVVPIDDLMDDQIGTRICPKCHEYDCFQGPTPDETKKEITDV
jgi:hypothetical protein